MSWIKKVVKEVFGGCPGCRDHSQAHIVSMSIVHKNPKPTTKEPKRPRKR